MLYFRLCTLVDITRTGQTRYAQGKERERYQQQNFDSLIQAISLRALPFWEEDPVMEVVDVSNSNFGTEFAKLHNLWTFRFHVETDDAYASKPGNIELLLNDLNLVPFIPNLQETIKINNHIFDTVNSATKNTLIEFSKAPF